MKNENCYLDEDELSRLAEIYKLFGSVPRLRILLALKEKPCSVNELTEIIGISQPATSHQLKDMKLAKIVKSRKSGRTITYSLQDDHISKTLEIGIQHLKGECEGF